MTSDRRASWLKGVLDLLVLASLTTGENYGTRSPRTSPNPALGRSRAAPLSGAQPAGGGRAGHRRVPGDRTRPGRRYYRLTDQGRQTLAEQGGLWLNFDESVRAVLAKGLRAPDDASTRRETSFTPLPTAQPQDLHAGGFDERPRRQDRR